MCVQMYPIYIYLQDISIIIGMIILNWPDISSAGTNT